MELTTWQLGSTSPGYTSDLNRLKPAGFNHSLAGHRSLALITAQGLALDNVNDDHSWQPGRGC